MLSDFAKREVSAAYGVLIPAAGVANRATFVIDKEGKITYIEEGSSAIDPTAPPTALQPPKRTGRRPRNRAGAFRTAPSSRTGPVLSSSRSP